MWDAQSNTVKLSRAESSTDAALMRTKTSTNLSSASQSPTD